MNLQHRIDLLSRLGEYILSDNPSWLAAKERAHRENGWFIPSFIDLAANNIGRLFLQREILEQWTSNYRLERETPAPKAVGIIMAGNIPLVGFHDFLCVFVSGHRAIIKTSSKDDVLIRHLVEKLTAWDAGVGEMVSFATMLKGCYAYIATGSNNSTAHFDFYFGKYPNIIRRNRTSAAILTGFETKEELDKLADDVFLYFGLGCRNVTKLYVPRDYDFVPLLHAFRKYDYLADENKYKNNYDYNLAVLLLNNRYYMSTPAILLLEEKALFSPISQLNYEFYSDLEEVTEAVKNLPELQCLVARGQVPFGQAQSPSVSEYADAVDTLSFLQNL